MMQEMVGFCDGSGISRTICKQSAPCSRQIGTSTPNHSIFTDQILFLTPNHHWRQRMCTERENRIAIQHADSHITTAMCHMSTKTDTSFMQMSMYQITSYRVKLVFFGNLYSVIVSCYSILQQNKTHRHQFHKYYNMNSFSLVLVTDS